MDLFKSIGKLLMMLGAALTVWDVVLQFVSKNIFKIRTFKEWGTDISLSYYTQLENYLHRMMSPTAFTKMVNLPFGPSLFCVGIGFYLFYRILFIAFGGKGGGGKDGFVYKSRH